MAKPLTPEIKEVLKKYKLEPKDALWDCHGTWVMLHKYIEQVAQTAKITTELKQIVDSDPNNVVVLVEGKLGDIKEWTFGEANPKNNKNAYPYSMAEKRAKDRVILKLIGLAGHIYSQEDVADENNEENVFVIKKQPEKELKWETTANVVTDKNGESNWVTWVDQAFIDLKEVRDPKQWAEWRKQYQDELDECYKNKPKNLDKLTKLINSTVEFYSPKPEKDTKNV
tara:strand:+ start:27098 stop:27775 length:678 start_codon:yes stop_codon:yes gene_type:complete